MKNQKSLCKHERRVKNGKHSNGKQRYRCKDCGYQTTFPKSNCQDKILALFLSSRGITLTSIASIVGVKPPAVSKWLKEFASLLINRSSNIEREVKSIQDSKNSIPIDKSDINKKRPITLLKSNVDKIIIILPESHLKRLKK